MRATNRSSTRNYLKYMNRALENQEKTSQRIDSGNRFERISDDVSSGVQAMKAKTELYKTNKQYSNIKSIDDVMSSAENSMTSIRDILTQINTKVTAAEDGGHKEQRPIYAKEISSLKNEILQLANTKYSGKYLFGGSNAASAPFTVDSDTGKVKYNGIPVDDILKNDNGSYYYMKDGAQHDVPMNDPVYMDIGLGIRMTGSKVDPQTGFDVSYTGPDILGFGMTDGSSDNLFNVIDDLEKALVADPYDEEAVATLHTKLQDLSDKFLTNITDIGSKTEFLDTMLTRLESNANNLDSKISTLTGTDYAEESIHQATNAMVTKALYQMGVNVIPMSLMDFVR